MKEERTLHRKKIYNYDTQERYMDAKMIGGNPNGIISFNRTPHPVFKTLYRNMQDRTWFDEDM